ncbi:MAG: DUF488 domain-containing protein [Chloroflexota bacterium]
MAMTIQTKSASEPATPEDGVRVLAERYWPRVLQSSVAVDDWLRDLAPSTELTAWYGHKPDRWEGFKRRYHDELDLMVEHESMRRLRGHLQHGGLTLVYGARDRAHNSTRVLAEYLQDLPALDLPRPRVIPHHVIFAERARELPPLGLLDKLESLWALFAFFVPLISLVTVEIILIYGHWACAGFLLALLLLAIVTSLRVLWRERRARNAGNLPPEERILPPVAVRDLARVLAIANGLLVPAIIALGAVAYTIGIWH